MTQTVMQRAAWIDLSSRTVTYETIEESWVRRLLGGRGVAARLLLENTQPGLDPLAPENVIVFSTGALAGTSAPTSGRTTVTTHGVQTNVYLKTTFGGHFGAALRMTGLDYLVILGKAPSPVYLWIDRTGIRILDAGSLWGMGIRDATRALSADLPSVEVVCIGPAGEHLVHYANIVGSYYCSASRCGGGAVMGSKNLKAIAVDSAGGKVHVADVPAFREAVAEARDAIYEDTLARQLFEFGTAADVDFFNEMHTHPAYNFRRSTIDDAEGAKRLSGRDWIRAGYLKRRRGCSACPICCHRYTEIDEGPFAGVYSGGPQLETVNALGPRCGNTDIELVLKLNEMCNDLGLDVSTTGSVLSWLMESYERGIVDREDLDGLAPEWGSPSAMLALVERISRREGIGDVLANGTRAAARWAGRDSWKWAMHGGKGLEITAVELRAACSYALAYAVNVRGADHLLTETIAEFGGTPEACALMERITGDAHRYCGGSMLDKRAEIVRWHEDIYAVSDALGICAFSTTAAYGINESRAARLFRAASGVCLDADQLMLAGRRIVTLERAYNMRSGLGRAQDVLPWRVMHETQPDIDPALDPIITQEKLDTMLDAYYRLHGWDPRTGNPSFDLLVELELGDLIAAWKDQGENGIMIG